MLFVKELQSKTYNERISEAMIQLPLLSSEWTNYNPSDPGITVLENLTAFNTLQGESITNLSYRAKAALLKMADITPKKGKCARLLLSASKLPKPIQIKAGQKFRLGDLCFEAGRNVSVGGSHITGVYTERNGKFHDISFCTDREVMLGIKPFGDKPAVGDSIYFMIDHIPKDIKETIFYIGIDETHNRNPVEDRADNIFASAKWEYYSVNGFKELKVRDYTGSFLYSGEIKLGFGSDKVCEYDGGPEKGYCIRATLTKADYDVRPRLLSVEGFLFEVWQKETESICYTTNKINDIEIISNFRDNEYIAVFAKEEKGSAYRKYELSRGDISGRYFLFEETGPKSFKISFDKEKFGYEPLKTKDSVRVILYNERMMRSYDVGSVIGYDDQEIKLPVEHIVRDSFCLIAKREDGEGGYLYDFVRPEKNEENALYYHLLENDGKIIIEDAGDYIGAELFIGMVAVTEGDKGNILAGNELHADNLLGMVFYNPCNGIGGAFRETLQQMKDRFVKDINTPYTAVTEKDYEEIVKTTPGLCIRKVHASINAAENMVKIVVMPGTDDEKPYMSENYIKQITERLEQRRLISTRFQIVQPMYTPVSVKGTVYVKRHYTGCKEKIIEALNKEINYFRSEKNFGDVLIFEEVFHSIEELDCVHFVYDLSISPENPKVAVLKDSDIYPKENCLFTLGSVQIDTVTYED